MFVDDDRNIFIVSDHQPADCRYYIFYLTIYVLQQQFLLLHKGKQSISFSEHLLFSFTSDLFTYQLDFSFLTICITCFRVSSGRFWHFLVLFWMLLMLVTVHEPCHVPHALWIRTSETIFMEICSGMSKEWVRSWSHVFLITKVKTFHKKLLAVCPEKVARRKKRKKTRMAIAKLFALDTNTKIDAKKYFIPSYNIYLFKVTIRHIRKRCEIRSKLTIKTPERHWWHRSGVFIVNSEHISQFFLSIVYSWTSIVSWISPCAIQCNSFMLIS